MILITKEMISAMKKAGSISFKTQNGIDCIGLTDDSLNTRTELTGDNDRFKGRAFAFFTSCSVSTIIKTFLSHLKDKDELYLRWKKDAGQTEELKRVDMTVDWFVLEIKRHTKTGHVRSFSYLMDTQVTKIDSSSRMIK